MWMGREEEQEANTSGCNAVSHLLLPTWTEEEIKSLQKADPDIHQMVHWLRTDTTPRGCPKDASWRLESLWVQRRYLTFQHIVLYRCWEHIPGGGTRRHLQLVLPAKLVKGVLEGLHNTLIGGHLGELKTLEKVRARFYWPGQRKEVEKWCRNCAVCNSRKSPSHKARAPMKICQTQRPMQRVAMDILGPLPETPRGNKYTCILVIGEYFTKWKKLFR